MTKTTTSAVAWKSLLCAPFIFAIAVGNSNAAIVTWDFNLPAASSWTPPYESVATLTLEDKTGLNAATNTVMDYVLFTLDPNELNSGYSSDPSNPSTVNSLNIVFSGPDDLSSDAFEHVSGAEADPESFGTTSDPLVAIVPPPNNAPNMDAQYKSPVGQLKLKWDTSSSDSFEVTDTSSWMIWGTTIVDNFSILAEADGNGPPFTFGIISVDPITIYDADGFKITPSPSNWVNGDELGNPLGEVPIPAAVWLFGSALVGFLGYARRRKASA